MKAKALVYDGPEETYSSRFNCLIKPGPNVLASDGGPIPDDVAETLVAAGKAAEKGDRKAGVPKGPKNPYKIAEVELPDPPPAEPAPAPPAEDEE